MSNPRYDWRKLLDTPNGSTARRTRKMEEIGNRMAVEITRLERRERELLTRLDRCYAASITIKQAVEGN